MSLTGPLQSQHVRHFAAIRWRVLRGFHRVPGLKMLAEHLRLNTQKFRLGQIDTRGNEEMKPIVFTVYGKAAPAGSKRSLVPIDKFGNPYRSKKTNRIVVNTVDANPKSKGWKNQVANEAARHMTGPLITGPVKLELTFFMSRPLAHYGTGRNAGNLKASAPRYHTIKPDVLKLARGVEDALTDVVWKDDSQIVLEPLSKEYGERPGVWVQITELK